MVWEIRLIFIISLIANVFFIKNYFTLKQKYKDINTIITNLSNSRQKLSFEDDLDIIMSKFDLTIKNIKDILNIF